MPERCEYCTMPEEKPLTREDVYSGKAWENQVPECAVHTLAEGCYESMYMCVEKDGRVHLSACGEGETDNYYPKFCPECGRDLRKINGGFCIENNKTNPDAE